MPCGDLPDQGGAAERPFRQQPPRGGHGVGDVHPAQPLPPRSAGEHPVEDRLEQRSQGERVARRDGVDRRAHQLRPDGVRTGHEPVQLGRVVAGDPVPQRDVRNLRHLALQPHEVLEDIGHRAGLSLEQQLAGERRPAQLAAAQHPGHQLTGSQRAHQRSTCSNRCRRWRGRPERVSSWPSPGNSSSSVGTPRRFSSTNSRCPARPGSASPCSEWTTRVGVVICAAYGHRRSARATRSGSVPR